MRDHASLAFNWTVLPQGTSSQEARTMHVAGVDGCRGGWLCVTLEGTDLKAFVCTSISDLLKATAGASVIAIDVPIGLPDRGSRSCDCEARKLLGPPRGSSVFPAPVRGVLGETEYRDACERHYAIDERWLSKQAFAILPKIREVDQVVRQEPALQQRLREVHPEVSFALWKGQAMQHRKSRALGRAEREDIIETRWPGCRAQLAQSLGRGPFQPDDCRRYAAKHAPGSVPDSCTSWPDA